MNRAELRMAHGRHGAASRALLLLPLVALFSSAAAASVPRAAGVWESNPPAAALLAVDAVTPPELAHVHSTIDLAAGEPAERFRLFEPGAATLVEADERESFHPLLGVELIDTESRRGPPVSYPETRVWVIEVLGTTFVGEATGLSVELRPACGGFSCGVVSGDGKDPLGLAERTPEMKDQSCRMGYGGCEGPGVTTDDIGRILADPKVQGSLQAVGGAAQLGVGLGACGAPEPTGLTKVACVAAVARGLDNAATGWRKVWTRASHETLTGGALRKGLQGAGMSPKGAATTAAVVEGVVDIASTTYSAAKMTSPSEAVAPPKSPLPPLDPMKSLADYRAQLGLPGAGTADDVYTAARLDIGGESFFGENAHRAAIDIPVNAQTRTHAEAVVFQQAKNAGVSSKAATLYVDRGLCAACGANGGLGSLMRGVGVEELAVVSPEGRFVVTAARPSVPVPTP